MNKNKIVVYDTFYIKKSIVFNYFKYIFYYKYISKLI